MDQSWKPSRKTLYVIGGLCAVTAMVFIFNSYLSKTTFNPLIDKGVALTTKSSQQDLVFRDSDGDGVLDWEESLWGLDPNKKDSDNNGITDDREITAKKISLGVSSTPTSATTTLTDQFSREFFSTFSALRQSGNLTKSNIDKLSKQGITSLSTFTIPDAYINKDIIISTSTNITMYRKEITATAKGLQTEKIGSEVRLLSKAMGKPRSDKLVIELQKIEQIYLTLSERTIKVRVPSKIQNTHLKLANTYHRLGVAVGGLSEIYNDPALSIVYFNEYKKGIQNLLDISVTMQKIK